MRKSLTPRRPPSRSRQLPRPPRLMPAGGAAGGARRSAASPLAHLSEAPSHGPTTRIRITDMATAIRATGMAIQPTATVIRPTVTAMDQGVPAMAMGQAPPVILKAWHNAASFSGFPLCKRKDIGSFTALVSPGIDRPELVGLAIPDHCRVVRTLGEQKPRHRRGNAMVPQQFELIENEQE